MFLNAKYLITNTFTKLGCWFQLLKWNSLQYLHAIELVYRVVFNSAKSYPTHFHFLLVIVNSHRHLLTMWSTLLKIWSTLPTILHDFSLKYLIKSISYLIVWMTYLLSNWSITNIIHYVSDNHAACCTWFIL